MTKEFQIAEPKWAAKSKSVWGGLVAAIPYIAPVGQTLGLWDATVITDDAVLSVLNSSVMKIIGGIAGLFAVYGAVVRKQPLTLLPPKKEKANA